MAASPHARGGGTPLTDSRRGTCVWGVGAELPSGKAPTGLPWGRPTGYSAGPAGWHAALTGGTGLAAAAAEMRTRPAVRHAPTRRALPGPGSPGPSRGHHGPPPVEHRCLGTRHPQRDPDTALPVRRAWGTCPSGPRIACGPARAPEAPLGSVRQLPWHGPWVADARPPA